MSGVGCPSIGSKPFRTVIWTSTSSLGTCCGRMGSVSSLSLHSWTWTWTWTSCLSSPHPSPGTSRCSSPPSPSTQQSSSRPVTSRRPQHPWWVVRVSQQGSQSSYLPRVVHLNKTKARRTAGDPDSFNPPVPGEGVLQVVLVGVLGQAADVDLAVNVPLSVRRHHNSN